LPVTVFIATSGIRSGHVRAEDCADMKTICLFSAKIPDNKIWLVPIGASHFNYLLNYMEHNILRSVAVLNNLKQKVKIEWKIQKRIQIKPPKVINLLISTNGITSK
jgi:hypothetical protein